MTVLYSIVVPAVVSLVTTLAVQERRLRREYRLEMMAENAAKRLLEHEAYKKRSFGQIKARLGGFEDDELRKLLVRAGAVRFKGEDDKEMWGLMDRNSQDV